MSGSPGIITKNLLRFDPDASALIDLSAGVSVTFGALIRTVLDLRRVLRDVAGSEGAPIAIEMHRGLNAIFGMLAGADEGLSIIPIDPRQPAGRTANIIEQSNVAGTYNPQSGKTLIRARTNADNETMKFPKGPVFFTSGTTGSPKGVAHTWSNLVSNAESFIAASRLDASSSLLHVFPLHYMAGFLNTVLIPLFAGARILLTDQFGARSGATFRRDVERGGATTAWLSPTMTESIRRLDRESGKFGEVFDSAFCGTGRLNAASREAFEHQFECTLLNSYGTSELLILTLEERGAIRDSRVAGVGRPLPSVEIVPSRIGAYQHQAESELLAGVPWAAEGYFQGDQVTPLETARGLFRTRDIGRIQSGQIYVHGRMDGVVVKGGTNVYPEPIEDIALRHEGVVAAALVGIPHAFWGEEPVLVVEVAAACDINTLRVSLSTEFSRNMVADQVPARILTMTEIPKSDSGKVLRRELSSRVQEMS